MTSKDKFKKKHEELKEKYEDFMKDCIWEKKKEIKKYKQFILFLILTIALTHVYLMHTMKTISIIMKQRNTQVECINKGACL